MRCEYLAACCLCVQAVKEGVRLTLSMGWQPTTVTVQGQEVLQGQLALPTGAHRRAVWLCIGDMLQWTADAGC